jgi:hypothetical protein
LSGQPARSYLVIAAAIVIAGVLISVSIFAALGQTTTTETTTYTTQPTTITMTTVSGGNASAITQPCGLQVWPISSQGPADQHTPVLLMSPGATGLVCIIYQSAWHGDQALFNSDASTFSIYFVNGTYTLGPFFVATFHGCTEPGAASCVQTIYHSFKVGAIPQAIQPSGTTDYIAVVYSITAPSNSTGFYDESAPWIDCATMPLAVGYQASQVNASDFTSQPLNECPAQPFSPVSEYVTGMNVTYINTIALNG